MYLNTFGLSAVYDIRELLFMFVRRVNSCDPNSSSTTSRTRIISDVHSTLTPTLDDLRAHVSASEQLHKETTLHKDERDVDANEVDHSIRGITNSYALNTGSLLHEYTSCF